MAPVRLAVGSRIIKYADQHVGPRVDPGAGAPLCAPAASSLGTFIAFRGAGAAALDDPAARRRADYVPAKKIAQII